MNKYLLFSTENKGIYLRMNQHGVLDLLDDLKGINLRDIGNTDKFEICRTLRQERVFAVPITERLPNIQKVTHRDKLSWAAYHAITLFEVKAQLSQIAQTFDKQHTAEAEYTYKIIGVLERIFSRGLDYRSWLIPKEDGE